MMTCHFILYVRDQARSTEFYRRTLSLEPSLNVPGMTEFQLRPGCVLGLMPSKGIKRLLGDAIPDPDSAGDVPRAELYLKVDDPRPHFERALAAGGVSLSPVLNRDWGDEAGYVSDPDGHVLAFACAISR